MKRFFLFLLVILGCFANEHPKIVYLRLISAPNEGQELYVGQKIEVKYSLLLFSNASLLDAEFIPNENRNLARGAILLNPSSNWIKKEDESYENTFIYKIRSSNFALPTLKIMAISQDGKYIDSDEVQGKRFEAITLNNEGYSRVLADEMRILEVRSKKYDEWNNIVIFTLQATGGNLEDFRLKEVEKQGFYGEIMYRGTNTKGVYYAVIPSHLKELKFTFFNLRTLRYEEKILPIVIKDDRVSTQTDLVPKNNFLIFSNILIALLVLGCLSFSFYLRKKQKFSWLFVGLACLLALFLIYRFFALKEVTLKPESMITILPTQNSTVMQMIQSPISVEVLGERGEFYKIKFEDSKIGWVKKNDCE